MLDLIKPDRLRAGDRVAAVSLSWGGAGDSALRWRYEQGKRFIQEGLALQLVEMPHTLKGSAYLYEHPEKRAQDLMEAFADPSIKGIFSCIGGDDSIRLLPYMDFALIRENPKAFLGYSDSTVCHAFCLHAGVRSYYGPSILAEFAENGGMFPYSEKYLRKALFSPEAIGDIPVAEEWTGEYIEWREENAPKRKTMLPNGGYECLSGRGRVQGPLIGGCVEALEMLKGTLLWPSMDFEDCILFLESSEEMLEPARLLAILRNYAAQGILAMAYGVVFGKPYQGRFYEEYRQVILQVLDEFGLDDLAVLYNASFGHNQPMACLPYGALAEIDCDRGTFAILESGVG